MEPKVSVIIPNYNRANVIGETIDALLKQTLKPFEIIVVDDGSTDNSLQVLKDYGDRIKILQQENKGPGAARNKGVLASSGEFIQFMDSDDVPSLNKLEVQVSALQRENADLVLGPWIKGWFDDAVFEPENMVLQNKELPAHKSVLEWFLTEWSMVFQQALVRRDQLFKVGLYDEEMKIMEDADLFVKLLLEDSKIIFEQESLTLYRLGSDDKLTNNGASNERKLKDNLSFYEKLFGYSNSMDVYGDKKFQLKLFHLIKELENYGVSIEESEVYINKAHWSLRFFAIRKRIKQGLQQRIKGHRWSAPYQASKLGIEHKKLISQLGYKLKE
ncbi:glycosyltransferase family A protein [Mangrovimonas sp. DI 80]|uniref:glycosyltransferase family 2 protein n=1 Tax=Mangrovimonas sp. DI 80 TaxID=1779330 RepID=UPI0009771E1F|nr:glycosyltransferase family A protein [Mangrovimonas sp. DI 80]OMP31781.1 hypothetical protein BKM32_01595 [Mangrovimonas sp. DI 80]